MKFFWFLSAYKIYIYSVRKKGMLVAHSCLTLCMDSFHGLQPTRLLYPWNAPGKNNGVVAIPFSRGSSQPRDQIQVLQHCRQILYCLSHQGSLYLHCTGVY